jgi:ABC-2 type transport system permease protein
MHEVRLLLQQIRYQLVQFVRIPVALFFTYLLPLLMLVLFNALFAGSDAYVETPVGWWPLQQFFVASLAAFTAVSATFTNLANTIPIRRQDGILKRWRGTPLARSVYLAGYIGAAIVIAAVGVAIMVGAGILLFDTSLDLAKLPALIVTFVIGVAAFSALGIAVTAIIRSAEAAPAVANAFILPLAFISDTFVPLGPDTPRWLEVIGDVFPLKPFVQSMQAAFNPLVDPPAFEWRKLAVVVAWGVFGLVVALRTFKWEPVGDDARRTERRARRAARAGS